MKSLVRLMTVLGGASMSVAALAQEAGAANYGAGLGAIGAALAIGLSAFAAASGQGRTATAAVEGIARNPGAKDAMFQPFILGLVFMEFQALLGFVIAILWTFK